MKQTWGRSRWCYSCNQWQVVIILVLFLSLSTYGIIKLTEDPYRTIMGELCDLPRPEYPSTDSRPQMEVWYSRASSNWADTSCNVIRWSTITDSMDVDSAKIGLRLIGGER